MPEAVPFNDVVTDEAELRALVGEPSAVVRRKIRAELDVHCRAFIARAPFVLVATTDGEGRCDVSPRGDPPGFVQVLDDRRLAIPERPSNRLADSMFNIMQTHAVGLLFLIPGVEDFLRVNGRAWVMRDATLLQQMTVHDKTPTLAVGVEVRECFFHCAKAIKRSQLWNHTAWSDCSDLASLGKVLIDQTQPENVTLAEMETLIEESYATRLY